MVIFHSHVKLPEGKSQERVSFVYRPQDKQKKLQGCTEDRLRILWADRDTGRPDYLTGIMVENLGNLGVSFFWPDTRRPLNR